MTTTLPLTEDTPTTTPDHLRILAPVLDRAEEPTPTLDVPPSRLPHDAPAEDRELDMVVRLLHAFGGSATYDAIHDSVPAAMTRPEGDTPGNPTSLQWALRRGIRDNWFTAQPDGYAVTYHLRDTGAARAKLPGRENTHLRDLLTLADQLGEGLASTLDSPNGWAADLYAGLTYKLAEIINAAGLAATRAGTVEHPGAFRDRVDVAFHDITRGR